MRRRDFLGHAALVPSALALSLDAQAQEPSVAKVATVAPDGTPWADHLKRFTASVLLDGTPIATGHGSSKKQAEMAAALDAWTGLQPGA